MPALSGDKSVQGGVGSRLRQLGIALPAAPTPLGAYVESSDTGNLLFLSGTLPVVNRKLAIAGRLGENLSVKDGQEAARIASLNALAVAKEEAGAHALADALEQVQIAPKEVARLRSAGMAMLKKSFAIAPSMAMSWPASLSRAAL